jgi:hypothetical protein
VRLIHFSHDPAKDLTYLSESHEKLSTLPKKPTVSDHGSEGVVGEVSTSYEEFPTTPAVPALQPIALKEV